VSWCVVTLDQRVDAELDALPKGLRAKFLHIAEMLEELGPFQVREPYVKALGAKLFEIRMKSEKESPEPSTRLRAGSVLSCSTRS